MAKSVDQILSPIPVLIPRRIGDETRLTQKEQRAQTETGTGGGRSKHGLPGSLDDTPNIDAWIRVDVSGAVTILTGKAELGQGLKTALLQVAAEELKVQFSRLSLVTADTARTPNEGYTAASHSMQDSGTAIRHAAAQAREILLEEAARRARHLATGP